MKQLKHTLLTLGLLAGLALTPGCALLLVGGVAAGAVYGTIKYEKNTLATTREVRLDTAWAAANAVLKDLQMPVTSASKDGASGKLAAVNAKNQPVSIHLTRKTDTVTELEITVGTFDSPENRTESQQIYDQMSARF
jgi:hypothetical protein